MKKYSFVLAAFLAVSTAVTIQAEEPAGANPDALFLDAEAPEDTSEASDAETSDAAEAAGAETAEAAGAFLETAEDSGGVASKDEMVTPEDVVEEGMVPIEGTSVKDGVYDVTVDSSSSMFKIVACKLTVKDGKMTAVLTMSSDGYLKLFMGTGEEAVKAKEEDYIPFVENEDGAQTYEVPVEALDQGIDCAAYSRRKEKWYDRVILFRADSLPQDAFAEGVITTPEDLALEDGAYTVDVVLEGGSGRTGVETPASMIVKDGVATATIIFSSSNYDYVIVGKDKILTTSEAGENSAFEIPVTGFDWKMPITGDTIAMGKSHEISYTLTFDSASIQEAEE